MATIIPPPDVSPGGFDLLRVPGFGLLLRARAGRRLAQGILLLLSAVLILHGFFGPSLAPKNLATLLAWVHYRGLLVLVLLVAGNFFCFACPFMLPRDLARWLFAPVLQWPRLLRNKWLALGLFVGMLFAYERFSLWETPWWTASVALGYFIAALVVDSLFKHATFCKYVCPIGQFNFFASLVSPLEVKVRNPAVCAGCVTKDCIRGRRAEPEAGGQRRLSLRVVQRGCELALFQPRKVGNMDCTFCMDCVHACPHDNIGVIARVPGEELIEGETRSGIGRFFDRPDLSAFVTLFTFGAMLNAFAMVSPVYALQAWLSRLLGTTDRTVILGLIFLVALVVEPVVLLGLAGWLTRWLVGSRDRLLAIISRRSWALAPLGFAIWLAHYGFHFFTGFLTVVPVTQYALTTMGWPVLGPARWDLGGMSDAAVYPLELGFLGLGLVGSLLVAYRQNQCDAPERPLGVLPWFVLCVLLGVTAVWLLSQPMEMRGTFLGG